MKTEKKTYRSGPFQDFFAEGIQVGNTLSYCSRHKKPRGCKMTLQISAIKSKVR